MKKVLYLLGGILLFTSCMEKEIEISKLQERNGITYEVNQTKGFTGKAISKYENGQIKIESYYKNGKIIDTYKEYYKNGQLKIEENHKDVTSKHYYETGKLQSELIYENGILITRSYYDDGQQVKFEIANGLVKEYYYDGKLKMQGIYKNGNITPVEYYK